MVKKACSLGPTKTLKQCKLKNLNLKDAYKKCKDENKQSGNQRRCCAFYKELDQVLSVRNVLKLAHVCEVGVVEELAQSPPEYHVDDDTTYDFQENEFQKNQENKKRKTLDLNESLESEAFVDSLEKAAKSKKDKEKKGRQRNI